MANKSDLFMKSEVEEEEAYKLAELKGMKLKYVSSKNNLLSIVRFIEELFYDYITKINEKTLLIAKLLIEKKLMIS